MDMRMSFDIPSFYVCDPIYKYMDFISYKQTTCQYLYTLSEVAEIEKKAVVGHIDKINPESLFMDNLGNILIRIRKVKDSSKLVLDVYNLTSYLQMVYQKLERMWCVRADMFSLERVNEFLEMQGITFNEFLTRMHGSEENEIDKQVDNTSWYFSL